jgi:hypothetical protein
VIYYPKFWYLRESSSLNISSERETRKNIHALMMVRIVRGFALGHSSATTVCVTRVAGKKLTAAAIV